MATRGRPRRPASPSLATRVTGAPEPGGDFLVDAQARTSYPKYAPRVTFLSWRPGLPGVDAQLRELLSRLERHFGDLQDTEFTVEEGRLYMLQARSAKRPAQAAVRFAVDAVHEGLLSPAQATATIDAGSLKALLHPTFELGAHYNRG